ncbi:hypothetical protein RF11_02570 [Thelohanellus kitauei]|uniref:Uncharacterized protein n=1 Tax=Thelohanellus kitauei TaxID=669202 RepID=A0A0C2M4X1_THEKT|nr:hypothetical protein RF11_02570 [Thelohanellus kitauei]
MQFISYFSYYVKSCTNDSITLANIDYMQLNNLSIVAIIEDKGLPPIKMNINLNQVNLTTSPEDMDLIGQPYNFKTNFSYQVNPRFEADKWTFKALFMCNSRLQQCSMKTDVAAFTRSTELGYKNGVLSVYSPSNTVLGETIGIVLQRGDEVKHISRRMIPEGKMISIEKCDTNGISLSHYPNVVYDFMVFVIDNFTVAEKILECSGINNTCSLFKDNIFVSANFTYLSWKPELSGKIQIVFYLKFSSPSILETVDVLLDLDFPTECISYSDTHPPKYDSITEIKVNTSTSPTDGENTTTNLLISETNLTVINASTESENLRNESANIDSTLYMNGTRIESQGDSQTVSNNSIDTNTTNETNQINGVIDNKEEIPPVNKQKGDNFIMLVNYIYIIIAVAIFWVLIVVGVLIIVITKRYKRTATAEQDSGTEFR